ncbi:MAG: hypothetical protein KKC79_01200 [Gammaproteobacteria bacterium]|nr:hypothetical protein [Gammaproteobacteria bacterium]MBU1441455.1 hypothetical protein [Gammaproteobacteria bacterium]MBU2287131.1 hypothetical protein [Gammaproteobacteria bacterium]MBU2407247.1 hypothetical protein [Gammaproteobacteria bacterium]
MPVSSVSSVALTAFPKYTPNGANDPDCTLHWLREFIGDDIVPVDVVLGAARSRGRSLFLVERLAMDWLVEQRSMRKRYWKLLRRGPAGTLRVPQAPDLDELCTCRAQADSNEGLPLPNATRPASHENLLAGDSSVFAHANSSLHMDERSEDGPTNWH